MYESWSKFDEVLTETIMHSFFETRVVSSAKHTAIETHASVVSSYKKELISW